MLVVNGSRRYCAAAEEAAQIHTRNDVRTPIGVLGTLLRDPDRFRARSLRPLTLFEGHFLTLTQLVEPSALDR